MDCKEYLVICILGESGTSLKYHMFKRLNTGGENYLHKKYGIAISIASLIEQIISYDCANAIVEAINQMKYGVELQSYKTGSVSGVKTRIRLLYDYAHNEKYLA